MKIHASDIAKELGLSKATVSLALNNKPGVSSKTRKAIFACRDRLVRETEQTRLPSSTHPGRKIVKIIVVSKKLNIVCEPTLGLWNEVFFMFGKELERLDYTMSIEYVDMLEDNIHAIVAGCSVPEVVGVILYATEMDQRDFISFKDIQKPMVVFDNTFGDNYHSVVIDNSTALQNVVNYLAEKGYRNIQYLAQKKYIYNFLQRRSGFQDGLRKNHLKHTPDSILPVGTSVESVADFMSHYLNANPLPEVFIMENYQISLGVIQALNEKRIRVPEDVSLFGVDALPDSAPIECRLRTVTIDHAEKALAAVMVLQKEIEYHLPMKFHILLKCGMEFGNSVK